MSWALKEAQTQTANQTLVLMILANQVNEETSQCLQTLQSICEESHLSRSSIKRILKQLQALGLVDYKPSFVKGVASEYRLLVPKFGGSDTTVGGPDSGSKQVDSGSTVNPPYISINKNIVEKLKSRRPERVSDDVWVEFWDHWRTTRNKSYKHITDRVISRQVNRVNLLVAANIDPNMAINLTLENGWQNIPEVDWIPKQDSVSGSYDGIAVL
jgi:hypothetical protein